MRCQACNKLLADKEILIDDSLCKKCRSYVYDVEDYFIPLAIDLDGDDDNDEDINNSSDSL